MAFSLIPLLQEYLGKNSRLNSRREESSSSTEQQMAIISSQFQSNLINSYQIENTNSSGTLLELPSANNGTSGSY